MTTGPQFEKWQADGPVARIGDQCPRSVLLKREPA